jgi:soluble lytic murein transglycosylase-like protein
LASRRFVISFVLLVLFSLPARAGNPEPDPLYDIQCGCYSDPANAARLVLRLQELGLSWYSMQSDLCTRFIVDVNVHCKGRAGFIAAFPEFADAFLVENLWDLPHPDPEEILPLPTSEDFTTIMAPYMQREYQHGYYNRKRLSMARQRARMYTRWIYEAAGYYGLDPFLLFAVGNFETYFRNMFGDLDRLQHRYPDPAQGMFQILGSTARLIYQDMRHQDVPHAPEELPADLRAHPKTQIYFAAHYLHILHLQHHGNRYMALLGYNGASNPNYEYPQLVMRFYQRAIRYFIQSSQRYREEKTAAVTCTDPTGVQDLNNRKEPIRNAPF